MMVSRQFLLWELNNPLSLTVCLKSVRFTACALLMRLFGFAARGSLQTSA